MVTVEFKKQDILYSFYRPRWGNELSVPGLHGIHATVSLHNLNHGDVKKQKHFTSGSWTQVRLLSWMLQHNPNKITPRSSLLTDSQTHIFYTVTCQTMRSQYREVKGSGRF